ncbi:aldehyde dehydrogenase family protein [Brevibacterium oceani]|uniref:aldehyde dehydrogenase family protein n=1 Tax=Brevibacterium oceani TaxID=358099 RepID=UPI0015E75016|nr:aldehyde dehydrogenase family protein [Brevibacterium oceani]
MNAQDAYNSLNSEKWAATSISDRLELLKQVQDNMLTHAMELGAADKQMRNDIVGEPQYLDGYGVFGTIGPMGGVVAATIDLYKSIAAGTMLTAKSTTPLGGDRYDVEVFPQTLKDRIAGGAQRGHLHVKGTPRQVNPLDKPAGVIAVLGAGNYSSSLETLKALFWENKAAIHKPHRLNVATDAVWQKIFAPLVDIGALAFCDVDQSRVLTTLDGLTAIYFTGGTETAEAIMDATDTPLVSECGGNNPSIVVPGDRPWTAKEIEHHAVQFASQAKMNGGAICGRAQTLVTSRHWPQREEFLDAVRKAFTELTPAVSMFYPGSDEVTERFLAAHPDADVLPAEDGKYPHSDTLLITGAAPESFATNNEAFCLINTEVPLDVPANAADFLPAAVEFCNDQLLGSLAAMVIIDDDTRKANQTAFDHAINDLSYGAVAVNAVPPMIFGSPYLIWGGNEEGKEFVSGRGNFGNALNYENVEKAVLYDDFIAANHFLQTTRVAFDRLLIANSRYLTKPTWPNLTKVAVAATRANRARRDF